MIFMNDCLPLAKLSFGTGDCFAHRGNAQFHLCFLGSKLGAEFIPVWNNSNREYTFTGTEPSSWRAKAEAVVAVFGWKRPCQVDADHIKLRSDQNTPTFNPSFRQLLHVNFKFANPVSAL